MLIRMILAIGTLGVAGNCGFADDDARLLDEAKSHFRALPKEAERPDTPERIRLGRALFFEPRMSSDGTTSCSRCHLPTLPAIDALPKSIGANDLHTPRNAPTVFNAALHSTQHWDGRFPTVEAQAKAAVAGPAFGNKKFDVVKERLQAIPGYGPLFRDAFPGEPDPITDENIGKSIGAFERTLVSRSRFDDYLDGDAAALSAPERDGLRAFMDVGCVGCHKGVGVGGEGFRKFGVTADYWTETGSPERDEGRFGVTKDPADRFKFKVPGLRNAAVTAPYFHDGSVRDLPRAVRVMARGQLGDDLTDEQATSIVAFLESLTGAVPENFRQVPELPPGGFASSPDAH